jgi:hypothetical protein
LEAATRTASWIGFHAAICLGALVFLWQDQTADRKRFLIWILLAAAGVAGGWRFFPRYYFLLLPVVVLAGARGLAILPRRWAAVCLLTLLIPLARFGPRYLSLLFNGDAGWADTAMNRDSRNVARGILPLVQPEDTILVWGYRPDVIVYTRLPLGTPFLDSQPLTGVLADRHLTSSVPTFPEIGLQNRRKLLSLRPTWVVDGLGPYNAGLAVAAFADLQPWLRHYQPAFRTEGAIVYRLASAPAGSTLR